MALGRPLRIADGHCTNRIFLIRPTLETYVLSLVHTTIYIYKYYYYYYYKYYYYYHDYYY
jgi:hypothetical protein